MLQRKLFQIIKKIGYLIRHQTYKYKGVLRIQLSSSGDTIIILNPGVLPLIRGIFFPRSFDETGKVVHSWVDLIR